MLWVGILIGIPIGAALLYGIDAIHAWRMRVRGR